MPNFHKDRLVYSTRDNIITADDEYHSRIRRLLSHAFSDKALREQESLLMSHVTALIEGLRKQSQTGVTLDLCDWFLWTTFDVIGDLSLGESFDCVNNRNYHHWVAMMMNSMKSIVFISVTKRFPPFQRLFNLYVPPKTKRDGEDHIRLAFEKVDRRLSLETSRPDFVSYMTKKGEAREEGGLTRDGVMMNATALISAGSETTGRILPGIIWYLHQDPTWLAKIKRELRGTFRDADDISLARLAELPSLQAIIDESLRMFSPAQAGQPRVTPRGGAFVDSHWIPEGTAVTMNQHAVFRSSKNFERPDAWLPERWLNQDGAIGSTDEKKAFQPFSIGARNCVGKK